MIDLAEFQLRPVVMAYYHLPCMTCIAATPDSLTTARLVELAEAHTCPRGAS